MKKIVLLVVAAVFVIGIQGCSTEEIGIEEENFTNYETNNKTLSLLDKERNNLITVFYPEDMSESTRDTFRNLMRAQVFSTLLKYIDNSCGTKETWEIDKYDTILFSQSGVIMSDEADGGISTETRVNATVEAEDEEETIIEGRILSSTIIGGFKFRTYISYNTPSPCEGELLNEFRN